MLAAPILLAVDDYEGWQQQSSTKILPVAGGKGKEQGTVSATQTRYTVAAVLASHEGPFTDFDTQCCPLGVYRYPAGATVRILVGRDTPPLRMPQDTVYIKLPTASTGSGRCKFSCGSSSSSAGDDAMRNGEVSVGWIVDLLSNGQSAVSVQSASHLAAILLCTPLPTVPGEVCRYLTPVGQYSKSQRDPPIRTPTNVLAELLWKLTAQTPGEETVGLLHQLLVNAPPPVHRLLTVAQGQGPSSSSVRPTPTRLSALCVQDDRDPSQWAVECKAQLQEPRTEELITGTSSITGTGSQTGDILRNSHVDVLFIVDDRRALEGVAQCIDLLGSFDRLAVICEGLNIVNPCYRHRMPTGGTAYTTARVGLDSQGRCALVFPAGSPNPTGLSGKEIAQASWQQAASVLKKWSARGGTDTDSSTTLGLSSGEASGRRKIHCVYVSTGAGLSDAAAPPAVSTLSVNESNVSGKSTSTAGGRRGSTASTPCDQAITYSTRYVRKAELLWPVQLDTFAVGPKVNGRALFALATEGRGRLHYCSAVTALQHTFASALPRWREAILAGAVIIGLARSKPSEGAGGRPSLVPRFQETSNVLSSIDLMGVAGGATVPFGAAHSIDNTTATPSATGRLMLLGALDARSCRECAVRTVDTDLFIPYALYYDLVAEHWTLTPIPTVYAGLRGKKPKPTGEGTQRPQRVEGQEQLVRRTMDWWRVLKGARAAVLYAARPFVVQDASAAVQLLLSSYHPSRTKELLKETIEETGVEHQKNIVLGEARLLSLLHEIAFDLECVLQHPILPFKPEQDTLSLLAAVGGSTGLPATSVSFQETQGSLGATDMSDITATGNDSAMSRHQDPSYFDATSEGDTPSGHYRRPPLAEAEGNGSGQEDAHVISLEEEQPGFSKPRGLGPYVDTRWLRLTTDTELASSMESALARTPPPGQIVAESFSLKVVKQKNKNIYLWCSVPDRARRVYAGRSELPIAQRKVFLCELVVGLGTYNIVQQAELEPESEECSFSDVRRGMRCVVVHMASTKPRPDWFGLRDLVISDGIEFSAPHDYCQHLELTEVHPKGVSLMWNTNAIQSIVTVNECVGKSMQVDRTDGHGYRSVPLRGGIGEVEEEGAASSMQEDSVAQGNAPFSLSLPTASCSAYVPSLPTFSVFATEVRPSAPPIPSGRPEELDPVEGDSCFAFTAPELTEKDLTITASLPPEEAPSTSNAPATDALEGVEHWTVWLTVKAPKHKLVTMDGHTLEAIPQIGIGDLLRTEVSLPVNRTVEIDCVYRLQLVASSGVTTNRLCDAPVKVTAGPYHRIAHLSVTAVRSTSVRTTWVSTALSFRVFVRRRKQETASETEAEGEKQRQGGGGEEEEEEAERCIVVEGALSAELHGLEPDQEYEVRVEGKNAVNSCQCTFWTAPKLPSKDYVSMSYNATKETLGLVLPPFEETEFKKEWHTVTVPEIGCTLESKTALCEEQIQLYQGREAPAGRGATRSTGSLSSPLLDLPSSYSAILTSVVVQRFITVDNQRRLLAAQDSASSGANANAKQRQLSVLPPTTIASEPATYYAVRDVHVILGDPAVDDVAVVCWSTSASQVTIGFGCEFKEVSSGTTGASAMRTLLSSIHNTAGTLQSEGEGRPRADPAEQKLRKYGQCEAVVSLPTRLLVPVSFSGKNIISTTTKYVFLNYPLAVGAQLFDVTLFEEYALVRLRGTVEADHTTVAPPQQKEEESQQSDAETLKEGEDRPPTFPLKDHDSIKESLGTEWAEYLSFSLEFTAAPLPPVLVPVYPVNCFARGAAVKVPLLINRGRHGGFEVRLVVQWIEPSAKLIPGLNSSVDQIEGQTDVKCLTPCMKSVPARLEAPIVYDIGEASITDIGPHHMTVKWSSLSDAHDVQLFRKGTMVYRTTVQSTHLNITDLQDNELYLVRIQGNRSGGHVAQLVGATPPDTANSILSGVCGSLQLDGTTVCVRLPATEEHRRLLHAGGTGMDAYEAQVKTEQLLQLFSTPPLEFVSSEGEERVCRISLPSPKQWDSGSPDRDRASNVWPHLLLQQRVVVTPQPSPAALANLQLAQGSATGERVVPEGDKERSGTAADGLGGVVALDNPLDQMPKPFKGIALQQRLDIIGSPAIECLTTAQVAVSWMGSATTYNVSVYLGRDVDRPDALIQRVRKDNTRLSLNCQQYLGRLLMFRVGSADTPSNTLEFTVVVPTEQPTLAVTKHLASSFSVLLDPTSLPYPGQDDIRMEYILFRGQEEFRHDGSVAGPQAITVKGPVQTEPIRLRYSKRLTLLQGRAQQVVKGPKKGRTTTVAVTKGATSAKDANDPTTAAGLDEDALALLATIPCLNPFVVVESEVTLAVLFPLHGLQIKRVTAHTLSLHWTSTSNEFYITFKSYRPTTSDNTTTSTGEPLAPSTASASTGKVNADAVDVGVDVCVGVGEKAKGEQRVPDKKDGGGNGEGEEAAGKPLPAPPYATRNISAIRPEIEVRGLIPGAVHEIAIRGKGCGDGLLSASVMTLPAFPEGSVIVRRLSEGRSCTVSTDFPPAHYVCGPYSIEHTVQVESYNDKEEMIECSTMDRSSATFPLVPHQEATTFAVRRILKGSSTELLNSSVNAHLVLCRLPRITGATRPQLVHVLPNALTLSWARHDDNDTTESFQVEVKAMSTLVKRAPKHSKSVIVRDGTQVTLTGLLHSTLYEILIRVERDFRPMILADRSVLTFHDDAHKGPICICHALTPPHRLVGLPHKRTLGSIAVALNPVRKLNKDGLALYAAVRAVPDNIIFVSNLPDSTTQPIPVEPTLALNPHSRDRPPTFIVSQPQNFLEEGEDPHHVAHWAVAEPAGSNTHRLEHFAVIEASDACTVNDTLLNRWAWSEPDIQPVLLVRTVSHPQVVHSTSKRIEVSWKSTDPHQRCDVSYTVLTGFLSGKRVQLEDRRKEHARVTSVPDDTRSRGQGKEEDPTTPTTPIATPPSDIVHRVVGDRSEAAAVRPGALYGVIIAPSYREVPCEPLKCLVLTAPRRPRPPTIQNVLLNAIFDLPATATEDPNTRPYNGEERLHPFSLTTTALVICTNDTNLKGCTTSSEYLSHTEARNVFKSTHKAQRIDIRLRSAKDYIFVFFHSAHHPYALNGIVHSKPTVIEHKTETFAPQNLHVITRTRASVTVGWSTLDHHQHHPNQTAKGKLSFTAQCLPMLGTIPASVNVTHEMFAKAQQEAEQAERERASNTPSAGSSAGTGSRSASPSVASTGKRTGTPISPFIGIGSNEVASLGGAQRFPGSELITQHINKESRDPQLHTTFSSLRTDCCYAFRVCCSYDNRDNSQWSEIIVANTLLPPRPVQSVTVLGITPTTVSLSWKDPQALGSESMTYLVSYRQTDLPTGRGTPVSAQRQSGEVKALECNATLSNLVSGAQYRVTVTPFNHIGETCHGGNATITVRTDGGLSTNGWKP